MYCQTELGTRSLALSNLKQRFEMTMNDTPNETCTKRHLTQGFYAKRNRVATPNETDFMCQMKQENNMQRREIIGLFAAVLLYLNTQVPGKLG
jgi:hypothetical protein